MLSGNCTEALSILANATISGSSAKLIKNGIAPLPAPLKQYSYIKRGERVRVRWACSILCNVRVYSAAAVGGLKSALRSGNIAFATGVNSVINLA